MLLESNIVVLVRLTPQTEEIGLSLKGLDGMSDVVEVNRMLQKHHTQSVGRKILIQFFSFHTILCTWDESHIDFIFKIALAQALKPVVIDVCYTDFIEFYATSVYEC